MKATGQPARAARLARALGLDRNPLRRSSDRAAAWVRVGLAVAFLIIGPIAAVGAGGWAYHTGIHAIREQGASAPPVNTAAFLRTDDPAYLDGTDRIVHASGRPAAAAARAGEVVAVVLTLALTALLLLAVLRFILAILTRRSLAAWEAAWSVVGPEWSRGHR